MQDKDFSPPLPGKGRPTNDAWPYEQAQALSHLREQLRPTTNNIEVMAADIKQMAKLKTPGRAMIEHILEPALTELFDAIVQLYELDIIPRPEDPKPLINEAGSFLDLAKKYFEPDE